MKYKWENWHILPLLVILFAVAQLGGFMGAVTAGGVEFVPDCKFPGEVWNAQEQRCVCPAGQIFDWEVMSCTIAEQALDPGDNPVPTQQIPWLWIVVIIVAAATVYLSQKK